MTDFWSLAAAITVWLAVVAVKVALLAGIIWAVLKLTGVI